MSQYNASVYADTIVDSVEEDENGVTVEAGKRTIKAQHAVVATNAPINDKYAIHTKQAPYRTYAMAFALPKGALPDGAQRFARRIVHLLPRTFASRSRRRHVGQGCDSQTFPRSLLGPVGSQAVEAMLKGAGSTTGGTITAIVGVVLLLIAAIGVVVQLKDALNTIWETKEPENAGWWSYVRTYLVSFAGIMGLGFLLAMSLVINTMLAGISGWLGGGESLFWQVVNFLVSLAVLTMLFAMMFKWFPDADVAWRNAGAGGLATALLFNIGKLAISWYIGTQGLESTYGAASSVVVLLIWIYYSAQIVLFGAEVTHVAGTHVEVLDARD